MECYEALQKNELNLNAVLHFLPWLPLWLCFLRLSASFPITCCAPARLSSFFFQRAREGHLFSGKVFPQALTWLTLCHTQGPLLQRALPWTSLLLVSVVLSPYLALLSCTALSSTWHSTIICLPAVNLPVPWGCNLGMSTDFVYLLKAVSLASKTTPS